MNVPDGVKITFDGGSFNGSLPKSCEFKNGAKLNANASNATVIFADGYVLSSDSTLSLVGGSLEINAATVDGELTCDETNVVIAEELVVEGAFNYSGAPLTIPTLTTNGALTLTGKATVENATLGDGAALTFNDGAVLAITTSATINGAQTVGGAGYLATPLGTSTENITQAEGADVRLLAYGAGLTAFNAYAKTKATVAFRWNATAPDVPFLIEKQISENEWETVSNNPTTATTDAQTAPATYRAFDGAVFITNDADPTTLNAIWRWKATALKTNGGSGTGTGAAWEVATIYVVNPQYE